jgi:hypothetical protein
MGNLYVTTPKDVSTVRCNRLPSDDYDGEKFLVETVNEQNESIDRFAVGLTSTFLSTHFKRIYTHIPQEEKKGLFAIRAAIVFGHGVEDKKGILSVTTDNFKELLNTHANEDEIDEKLIPLVLRFFKKYPRKKFISPQDLFVSTGFDLEIIIDRLEYLEQREFVVATADQRGAPYRLAPGGMDKLEQEVKIKKRELEVANRYFQLTPISIDTTRPFVFVLMPFKNDEFTQSHYFDVIKPTIENELKLQCIRSDEITDPGVINDQIYTGIVKAKLIIAEVSTQNPNVFYELGLAHAIDKSVFIFRDKDADRLPFDISAVRAINYKGKEDMKQKLISFLSKHINDK